MQVGPRALASRSVSNTICGYKKSQIVIVNVSNSYLEMCGSFDCSKFNNEPGTNFWTIPFLNLKEKKRK